MFGFVNSHELKQTADGSDPQQAWAAKDIRGKWGTLRSLDGSVPGLPDVTGLGPNPAGDAQGQAFVPRRSRQVAKRCVDRWFGSDFRGNLLPRAAYCVEAELALTKGSHTAFVGLALVAGEGDYRELALMRQADGKVTIDGSRYFAYGQLIGKEALDHLGGQFSAAPGVRLYSTGNPGVPDSFVEGFVGPVRLWVGEATAAAPSKGSRP